jgi:hypothetical protein
MREFILWLACLLLWFKAVITDAASNQVGWVVVDCLIPPLGVLRGLYLFVFPL